MGSTILGTNNNNNNGSNNNTTSNSNSNARRDKDMVLSKSRVSGKQLNCEIFPLARPSRAANHPGNRKGLSGKPINAKDPLGTSTADNNSWGSNNPPGVGVDGWVGPAAAGYASSGYSPKLPLYCYKGDPPFAVTSIFTLNPTSLHCDLIIYTRLP